MTDRCKNITFLQLLGGCLLPTGCLLPRGCLLPLGCLLPGGVYFPGGGGCLLLGVSASKGVSAQGVYPSMYWGRQPPCGQNDRQVLKHNLSANSFADGNYEDFSLLPNRHVLFQTHFFLHDHLWSHVKLFSEI